MALNTLHSHQTTPHTVVCIHKQLVQADSHCTEEQRVLISGVIGSQVVEVEDPYLEHSVVGTHTQVGHHTDGQ